jgi:hypothetical protein
MGTGLCPVPVLTNVLVSRSVSGIWGNAKTSPRAL